MGSAWFILRHPALTQETRERMMSLEEELVADLPPGTVAAVQAYAEEKTLERVVAEMLEG